MYLFQIRPEIDSHISWMVLFYASLIKKKDFAFFVVQKFFVFFTRTFLVALSVYFGNEIFLEYHLQLFHGTMWYHLSHCSFLCYQISWNSHFNIYISWLIFGCFNNNNLFDVCHFLKIIVNKIGFLLCNSHFEFRLSGQSLVQLSPL